MSDEVAEIIPRPPSSPIGSTMLIVSTIGMILAISMVWSELYGEYLPAGTPPAEMSKHVSRSEAEKKTRDHFAEDFPNGETLSSVEADLQLSSTVGDLSAGSGGGGGGGDSGGGGGETPPVENPDGGGGQ